MKTIAATRRWAGRLQVLFQLIHDADQRVFEQELRLEQAEHVSASRQYTKWQADVEMSQSQLDILEQRLFAITGRKDRDSAFEVLVDVSVRLDAVIEVYEALREALATRERLGDLLDGESDPPAEYHVAEIKCMTLELQLQRAMRLLNQTLPTSARLHNDNGERA